MKTCNGCGESKPPGDFYENRLRCRACYSKQVRENRQKRRAYWLAYQRRYFLEHKADYMEHQRRYRAANTLKSRARYAVNNAVRRGKLVPAPCEKCGAKKGQAHHADYARRLDVRWLCGEHHRAEHATGLEL